jgi:hypothetical protein
MAIATRDMTGKLSDAPELAQQVKRLAALRRATAPFVSHGTFRDDRGLQVEGGKGFVFTSGRGLAVTLANGRPKPVRLKVRLTPEQAGLESVGSCTFHVEGAAPRTLRPVSRQGALVFELPLPAFGAGVVTLAK